MNRMKRILLGLLAFVVVAGALVFALAPAAAKQYRLWRDAKAVEDYRNAVDALDTLECGTLLARARDYNAGLRRADLWDAFSEADADGDAESEVLDMDGLGVIAVLEIPKLGLILPVYRGQSPEQLDKGVIHLEGSSLPVGGDGAHCVLAGLADGRLISPMDGLERLMQGDLFTLKTLRDTLTYEVETVETLTPDALASQTIGGEADTCTLMTAITRDGEEFRLLARAHRVQRRAIPLEDDTQVLPGWAARLIFAAPLALAGLLVLALIEWLRRAAGRRRVKKLKL